MAPDLVLAAHGTRSPAGQQTCAALAQAVADRLPGVAVHLGWADVLTPTLTETLTGLRDAVVVPAFLTAGYHVTSDLPAAIEAAGGRARLAGRIGPALIAAVAERLAEAGGPGDAVVLAAAGSKRRSSTEEVALAARRLARVVGRPVVPAFVTSAAPAVGEAVAGLRARGFGRVAVASYLLAPGVFADRLLRAGADVVSAPIGVHPRVVEAVLDAYLAVARIGSNTDDEPATAPGVERIA